MDAVTYPDAAVAAFVSAHFVPLRLAHDAAPWAETYGVRTTPTLVVLEAGGGEVHRLRGYLAPEELLAGLALALAKRVFAAGDWAAAEARLAPLAAGRGETAAEAVFLAGQAGHRARGDTRALKAAWQRLARDFPDSPWTRQAARYRLL